MRHLKRDKHGISSVIVVMLSLVLIVIVVGNVVIWSYEMNQLDWDKMQEKIDLVGVDRLSSSPWFLAKGEYAVEHGLLVGGTYLDTQNLGGGFESFSEEPVLIDYSYNPSSYTLLGSTEHVSGSAMDISTDNGVYAVFRSFPTTSSAQTSYVHSEVSMIADSTYYQLKRENAESSGTTVVADASTTGRKLLLRSLLPLTGVISIPASTWSFYYRTYKTGADTQVIAHCDIGLLIRKADGTVRTVLVAEAADSTNLNRDTWTTVSGAYAWNNYTVVDDSDFLELDYYAHVVSAQNGRNIYLRIDDSNLTAGDQTRIAGMMLPSRFTVEVELTGTSDPKTWESIEWTVDSAFTFAEVNTTVQLYSYLKNAYANDGDGYLNYISSINPNTDETENKTVFSNSTQFRDASNGWKLKISGTKDTTVPFDLEIDWVEFKPQVSDGSRLIISNDLNVDLNTYPLNHARGIEIFVRYNVTENGENCFLWLYNWTAAGYGNSGFNVSDGNLPRPIGWTDYAVRVDGDLRDYVDSAGRLRIQFADEGEDSNQTDVSVDFFAARVLIDGVQINIRNSSPLTVHVIALWIINETYHQRFSANQYINSGDEVSLTRPDVNPPQGGFAAKVVTERGNVAVFP